jgi:hypothetical protein
MHSQLSTHFSFNIPEDRNEIDSDSKIMLENMIRGILKIMLQITFMFTATDHVSNVQVSIWLVLTGIIFSVCFPHWAVIQ